MIKTTAIIFASAASLGASTTAALPPTAPTSEAPAHFEITAGPLHIVRENRETNFKIIPNSDSLLRVELSSGKTLNIKL